MAAPLSNEEKSISQFDVTSSGSLYTTSGTSLRSPARSTSYKLSPARLDPSTRKLLLHRNTARQSCFDVAGYDGSTHSYGVEELDFFASYINQVLCNDTKIQHRLPVDEKNVLEACSDGIIMCHLVNHVSTGSVPEKLINRKEPLSVFQAMENCNNVLTALKGLGSNIVNIGASDVTESKPVLVLALLWQIVRTNIVAQISITSCPQLKLLKNKGETEKSFAALPVEQVLLRWFNHQLKWSGCSRTIKNFDKDLADGHCFMELLHRLGRGQSGSNILAKKKYSTPNEIASHVIKAASSDLNVQALIQPHHILEGNSRLNMAFVAQLFNACPDIVDTSRIERTISGFQSLCRRNSLKEGQFPEASGKTSPQKSKNFGEESFLPRTEFGILTKSNIDSAYTQPSRSMFSHLLNGKNSKTKKIDFDAENRYLYNSNADYDDSDVKNSKKLQNLFGYSMYEKVRDSIEKCHESYYTPISESITEWSKRNPTLVTVVEKSVKPVTVMSLLSVMQMVFQVSREMSIAGSM